MTGATIWCILIHVKGKDQGTHHTHCTRHAWFPDKNRNHSAKIAAVFSFILGSTLSYTTPSTSTARYSYKFPATTKGQYTSLYGWLSNTDWNTSVQDSLIQCLFLDPALCMHSPSKRQQCKQHGHHPSIWLYIANPADQQRCCAICILIQQFHFQKPNKQSKGSDLDPETG